MSALQLLAAAALCYGGFACLALAMPDHWVQAGGRQEAAATLCRPLRRAGAMLLAAAYALCVCRDGASFGTLLWVVLVSAGALAVALTLTWRPHWLLAPARALRHRA
ncbi:uncharacterized protein DUF3325 [Pseudoduganella flava]|uniref:DUF3325 family protein n=1 Tax=Pseudoduganella flava TaxID=871742 RepID=A0A562Q1K4_9BURK|nr:DUF3325 domain-containing protein [Pseudoduganella flava]QGZ38149.1 DUF3325 family protein [Pseudoduganella flava]TWI50330.1 uncharacterized protein DUF3325 [Pseudoduganella flava]